MLVANTCLLTNSCLVIFQVVFLYFNLVTYSCFLSDFILKDAGTKFQHKFMDVVIARLVLFKILENKSVVRDENQ